jgi:hypothetical protein
VGSSFYFNLKIRGVDFCIRGAWGSSFYFEFKIRGALGVDKFKVEG